MNESSYVKVSIGEIQKILTAADESGLELFTYMSYNEIKKVIKEEAEINGWRRMLLKVFSDSFFGVATVKEYIELYKFKRKTVSFFYVPVLYTNSYSRLRNDLKLATESSSDGNVLLTMEDNRILRHIKQWPEALENIKKTVVVDEKEAFDIIKAYLAYIIAL